MLFFSLIVLTFFWNVQDGLHLPTGKATTGTRVSIQAADLPASCNISLSAGRNLVGIVCRNTSNTTIANRLEGLGSLLMSAHIFDANDTDDPWKTYVDGVPSYVVVDLLEHDATKGYWLYVNLSTSLNLSGVRAVPTAIPVVQGPNLIGYQSVFDQNITEALDSIDGDYTFVVMYNTTLPGFQTFRTNGTSNFTNAVQNLGYWVNISSNTSIILI